MSLFLLFVFSSVTSGSAHVPLAFEPERIRQSIQHPSGSFAYGDPALEDFSFENPFDIVDFLYQGLNNFVFPPEQQQRLPQTALFVPSRLSSDTDMDWYMFDMRNQNLLDYIPDPQDPRDHSASAYDLVGYAIVPACKNLQDFYPSVALLGPVDTTDTSGNLLFDLPSGNEPFDVPDGYGVIVKPGVVGKRTVYSGEHSGDLQWLLPINYPHNCIEDYRNPDCMASSAVITVLDIPFDSSRNPFYFVVFNNSSGSSSGKSGKKGKKGTNGKKGDDKVKDFDFVYGTTDKFLSTDFIRLGAIWPFIESGRNLGQECKPID